MTQFYRLFIDSVLSFIVAWFGNLNLANMNRIGLLVKVASKVILGESSAAFWPLLLAVPKEGPRPYWTDLINPCRDSLSSYSTFRPWIQSSYLEDKKTVTSVGC